jgi:hypothetical protein
MDIKSISENFSPEIGRVFEQLIKELSQIGGQGNYIANLTEDDHPVLDIKFMVDDYDTLNIKKLRA